MENLFVQEGSQLLSTPLMTVIFLAKGREHALLEPSQPPGLSFNVTLSARSMLATAK